MNERMDYAMRYISQYFQQELDKETIFVGNYLLRNTYGRVIDLGCGPCLHLWAFFMVHAKQIDGIDIAQESINLYRKEILKFNESKYKAYETFIRRKSGDKKYSLAHQIGKICCVKQGDFTKEIHLEKLRYDTAVFTYSLGCLKNRLDAKNAIYNAFKLLKSEGMLISINTNGRNRNSLIPEYTWQGLPQNPNYFMKIVKENGFTNCKIKWIRVNGSSMYKYNKVYILTAKKNI